MYRHCIHCHRDLGRNEVLEHWPIGARLAYDPQRGRLWVVCRACERWNLAPLEDRWEALEEAERLFRGTRLRYSTPNIGLARLAAGVDLVRIGSPLRPELAAWRYGEQFGQRRRRHLLWTGALLVLVPTAVFSVPAALGVSSLGGLMYNAAVAARAAYRRRRTLATPRLGSGEIFPVTYAIAASASLEPAEDSWQLVLDPEPLGRLPVRCLRDHDAITVARALFPLINRSGGSQRTVERAIQRLEQSPDLNRLFTDTAVAAARGWNPAHSELARQSKDLRLALEMHLHEDLERRSFEGDLAGLEAAWRTAEEVAAIADGLLIPPEVPERLAQLRANPDA